VNYADHFEREPSSQAASSWNSGPHPAPLALLLAMFLYAVSLIKFFVRDPLSTQTGPQGPIELALMAMAGLALLAAFRGRYWKILWTLPAKTFVAFGALAVVSSLFSYDPLLSFLKGLSFILVCAIAVVASSAFGSAQTIKYLYYSVLILLVAGLAAKMASGGPLWAIDGYSGRARLTMFAWHPGTLADLCALTLLSGLLLPKRPPLYCPLFLFTINIAAASRASSALLVVILLSITVAHSHFTPHVLFLCCCLGSLLTLAMLVAVQDLDPSREVISIGQDLYGDKFDEDIATLSGRKEVWTTAAPLISHCLFLGYGLDGARDVLLNNTSWPAGNTHNSLIDLILAGGLPGMLLFLLGCAAAARRALQSRGFLRIAALGMYAYIAGFGLVSPNLTYLQGLASFLILAVDAILLAQASLGERASLRYLQWLRQNAWPRHGMGASA
jgi:O-antigen ligase